VLNLRPKYAHIVRSAERERGYHEKFVADTHTFRCRKRRWGIYPDNWLGPRGPGWAGGRP